MSGVSMTSGVTDLLGPRAAQASAARVQSAQLQAAERKAPSQEAQASRPASVRPSDVSRPAERVKALTPEAKATLRKIDEAAQAFEQIFVKKLLESAHFGPEGQHGAMGIDALARGVTSGGGLGLGNMIRDTMLRAEHPELAASLRGTKVASPLQRLGVTDGETPAVATQEQDA